MGASIKWIAASMLAVAVALPAAARAQGVPGTMSFSGRLQDAGGPVTGVRTVDVRLFAGATGGAPVWTEAHPAVTFEEGLLFLELGATEPLDDGVLDGTTRWLEVVVDGAVLAPRLPVASVPYAIRAGSAADADTVDGLAVEDLSLAGHDHDGDYLPVGASLGCPAGELVSGLEADGDVTCAADASALYRAGVGLSLAGDTFAVSYAGGGTATTAARSDHDHAGRYLPLGDVLACAAGQVATAIGAGGDLVCSPDADTEYLAGAGLSLSADTFAVSYAGGGTATTAARSDHDHAGRYLPLGDVLVCAAGQVATAIGAGGDLVCSPDADTEYLAGTGLLLAAHTFAVAFAGSGTAATAARSDHDHAGRYLPAGTSLACAGTDKVRAVDPATGNLTCAPDAQLVYTGAAPVAVAGTTVSLSTSGCATGEVWKYTGSTWSCEPDATGTAYTAGTGISLAGGAIAVDTAAVPLKTGTASQRFDGGTLVIDYAANRVLVNDTGLAPAGALDVNGIAAANEFRTRNPYTRYVSVPGSAFVASGNDQWGVNSDGYGYIEAGTSPYIVNLGAAVQLPDDAEVTELRCYYYDGDAAVGLTLVAGLQSRLFAATGATLHADVSVTTTAASSLTTVREGADAVVATPVVDGVGRGYHLHVFFSTGTARSDNVRFYGCRIRYTSDLLQP